MKKQFLFLLLCALQFCASVSYASTGTSPTVATDNGIITIQYLPKERAVSYARSKYGNNEYDFYVSSNIVSNPVVGARKLSGNYWLVLVDMKPGAGWEHECRHIYVDASVFLTSGAPAMIDYGTTCPPSVAMEPASVKNRYGSNVNMKASVSKTSANAETSKKFSGKTYAIILSGGISPSSNHVRYWNDCSFIYQTLRNRYGVPKANIKVVMADGTDPAADMNPDDGGAFISSPLDLDEDGIADIEYAATKENVKSVIEELSSKMRDEDHLFLYVIDHGGYDKVRKQSYICLWNGEKLYPDELNGYLSHGDAGYVSVLMGQCYSGGFVETLKANNRVVMTACSDSEYSYACEEIPFDEFVYHWTSAINGYDAFGNKVVAETETLPNGKAKPVSLVKAYNYACTADMYTDGKLQFARESPMLSILEKSTAEDLSIDSIPPTVYLCISKGTTPTQAVINGLHNITTSSFNANKFWNSDDIWLRNQKDGFVNQQHETPHVTEDNPIVYLYSKILNRGVKPYNGSGWTIWSGWSKSAFVITKAMWTGEYSMSGNYWGGKFSSSTVKDKLMPGDTTIVQLTHAFTDEELEEALKPGFDMCLIADIYDQAKKSDIVKSDSAWIYDGLENDRIAQKNRINMFASMDSVMVRFDNPYKTDKDVEFYIDCKEPILSKNIRAQLCLPTNVARLWIDNGVTLSDATLNHKTGIVTVNGKSAVCDNVKMKAFQRESIGFRYNVIASEEIKEAKTYDINVAVYDKDKKKFIGGETFRVAVSPRPAINPVVEKSYNADGTYTLTTSNVNESVTYNWYDKEGNLIGTGPSITVPANSVNNEYTVEVVSNVDKAMNSATTQVERVALIKGVTSGENETLVTFSAPVRGNTSVSLSSANSSVIEMQRSVKEGDTECSLPTKALPNGIYQIVLKESGKATESRKFEKK